jgi:hypothetical protein
MKRKPRERERKQPERWVDQARGFPSSVGLSSGRRAAGSADLPSKARPDLDLPASERRAHEREIARKTATDPKKSRT